MNAVRRERPSFRALSRPGGMTASTYAGRTASLALLRARLSRLPGVLVRDVQRRGAGARLVLDVAATGVSGYELGRRMRAFAGVPLELCRADHLVVVIGDDEEVAASGERLLFALAHACVQQSANAVAA
jgi:hypothetical protein